MMNSAQITQQLVAILSGLCWGTTQARPLGSPTLATGGAGAITAGVHQVALSYVRAAGESPMGPSSAQVAFSGAQAASVTVPDVPQGVSSVNVYATLAGGSVYHLLGNVAGAGTFSLSVADGTLAGNAQPLALEPVFARVGVTSNPAEFDVLDSAMPLALVVPESEEDNAEHPDIVDEARWTVLLFAANANDQAGGAALVGAVRKSLGVSSEGRGVLDLGPISANAILAACLTLGVRPRVKGAKAPTSTRIRGVVAARALDVLVTRLPQQPAFAPVRQLLGVSAGGHTVTLTWALPPDRWDLVGVVVRRGTSGGAVPSSPTAGTNVAVSGLPTGVTDSPGAGTWPYAVFGAYDSTRDPTSGARDPSKPVTDYSGSQAAGSTFTYYSATLSGVAT